MRYNKFLNLYKSPAASSRAFLFPKNYFFGGFFEVSFFIVSLFILCFLVVSCIITGLSADAKAPYANVDNINTANSFFIVFNLS